MSVLERPVTQYASSNDARTHFKDILDAASDGRVVRVHRKGDEVAVVRSEQLRDLLLRSVAVRPEMTYEDGAWAIFLPGLPLAAEAEEADDAVDDLLDAIREYEADWHDRLRFAPNHAAQWPFVQLAGMSSDEQLREWITGSGAGE